MNQMTTINNDIKEIQTEKYIGIPYVVNGRDFDGIDCYGLVRLVYKEELGIDLPSFAEEGINPERTQELISQYKEGWEPTENIQAGDVVIFRVMGVDAHIAIAVSSTHFLHARQGYNSAIESFDSPKWKTRLVGSYKYSPVKSVVLNGIPHPLRTERITTSIPAGTNVVQLEQWILKEYKIDAKLHPYVKVLVNGIPIPDAMKEATVIQENDCVEYRVVPQGGGDPLRTILTIAVIIAAPQLVAAMETVGGIALTTAAGGLTAAGSAAVLGLTAVGMALVDAIAPVRIPTSNFGDPTNPGSAEQQLMVTGGANRATPYAPIPLVLGKVRMTPPLGANSYYMFSADGKESYLNMLLTWGYGPLAIDETTLRIGEININTAATYTISGFVGTINCTSHGITPGYAGTVRIAFTSGSASGIYSGNYTVSVINADQFTIPIPLSGVATGNCLVYNIYDEINLQTLDRITVPTTGELKRFNGLYGTDVTQVLSNVELTCDGWNSSVQHQGALSSTNTITLPADYIVGSLVANRQSYDAESGLWSYPNAPYSIVGNVATFSASGYPSVPEYPITYYYLTAVSASPGPWLNSVSTDGVVDNFTIAIHFPQGCRKIASQGSSAGSSYASPVTFEIQYKNVSSSDWISAGFRTIGDSPVKDAFTKTITIYHQASENVQVRIRRLTGTGYGAAVDNNYQWLFQSVLLNVTYAHNALPAIDPVGATIAKTAFKIKASDQLNGQIEGINAVVMTYGKDWNGSTWVDGPINNPAALFRYVLEHPSNPRRVTDTANKINLTQVQYWYEYCLARGFTFNTVVASSRSVLDILGDICAAGRASPAMVDGKWTVVIDEAKSNVVQHFTPHNSWGFEGTKALPRIPDGLRVTFINENKDFQEDEVIVYDPTKSQTTATLLETISVPGVTTAAQAIDHARWHMAQAKLRPETYTLNTDIEYIVCNRGDRVKVMHDVAMWGLGSGRIKNKLNPNIFELTEEVPVTNAGYNFRFRSKSGGSTVANLVRVLPCTNAARTSNIVTLTLDGTGNPLTVGDIVTVAVSNASYNTSTAIVTSVAANTFSYTLAGADIASAAVTGNATLNDDNYSKVKIDAFLSDSQADNDDLFLYGTTATEAQDCVVLAIEPMQNKSARLTLVDYGVTTSYNIFTDYLTYTAATAFESQISLPPKFLIDSFGTKVPTITGFISDERVMERIAAGVFAYKMQVSYTNAAGLPSTTSSVEFQWNYSTATDDLGVRSKQTPYNLGNIMITDVSEGETLKVRARYVGSDGRTGLWTAWQNHTIVGKRNPPGSVTGFTATPDITTGKLNLKWNKNPEVDLAAYEVRTDTVWGSATNQVFLGDALTCSAVPDLVDSVSVFYIRAIDYSGNRSVATTSTTYTAAPVVNVSSVTHSFYDTSTTNATITVDWVDVAPEFGLKGYEISYVSGASTITRTLNGSFITVAADWIGSRAFTIKTVDLNGVKSSGFIYNVSKSAPNAPLIASFNISQGTMTLDWPDAVKTSLPIWGYEVRIDTNFGTPGFLFKGAASACVIANSYLSLGLNTFYIKTIDTDGYYSNTYYTAGYSLSLPPNITAVTSVFADTSLTAATVTLSWNDVSPVFDLSNYEISYDSVVATSKSNTITLPANWIGDKNFVIKTVDHLGNKSTGFTKIVTKALPNPVTNFRAQVIDNNVMLYWDLPAITSLPIDHVLLKKGATWATAAVIGDKKGAFTSQSEIQAGTYTYWIAVVDTDNNFSTPVSLTTKVSEAPDFVFHADYTSTFSGTKASATVENSRVLLPINTTETFQQHFTSHSWTTPQDQVTAGYPVYIQPANGSGYYEETFDFASILSSSRITVVYNGTVVGGTPVITTDISVSDDNTTWTTFNGVSDIYSTAFRYVKVRFNVVGTGTSIYSLSYLNVKLDAKLINDAGTVTALSTDTLGTIVNFNKSFIDITSITLSANATTAVTAVYDFKDANISATYAVVSNVCTVTATAHGLITGQKVRLQVSTGLGITGVYTITGYTANTFTVAMVVANTSGNNLVYPESCRVYVFDSVTGARVTADASWSVKGY